MIRRHAPATLAVAVLASLACGPDAPGDREQPPGQRPEPEAAPPADRDRVSPPGAPEPIELRLRLQPQSARLHGRVELDLAGREAIHVLFRTEWSGYPGLSDRLRELEAWSEYGDLPVERPADPLGPGHRIVRVTRPGRLTLSYIMQLDPPADAHLYHRVSQLSEDGGHLIGRDVLPRIWISRPRGGRHPVQLRFEGLPPRWRVVGIAERVGTAYAVEDLGEAVLMVGPLRSHRLNIGQRSLTNAIYGDWPVSDDRIYHAVERIAGGLHRIAGGGWAAGDYLLGAGRVPPGVRGLATGGQVLGHSAIVYVSGSAPGAIEFRRWLHTTAHELMHWYIPTAFRFEREPPAWFAEGFTDYFAVKTLYAGGLLEPEAFLREIAERLQRYRANPLYGSVSMADAQTDFWENDAYRFIYDGGTAAAFLLDLGFQARGRSLERAIADVRRSGPLTGTVLAEALASVRENEWIRGWLRDGTNPDWDTELARYRLHWQGDRLVSSDDWATDALASIRP